MSAFLATYLAQTGKDVILLDADLDSFNLGEILRAPKVKVTPDKIEVVHFENMDFFSMAMIAKDKAISMSADSYVQILMDLLSYAEWKVNLKKAIVVIDCPAGASTVYRQLAKAFAKNIVGAVLVGIPQAYTDLERVVKINQHFGIPILGVIENMAYFRCMDCGKEYNFSDGKIPEICERYGVEYLGSVPFSPEIRECVDAGIPFVPEIVEPVMAAIAEKIEKAKPAGDKILARLAGKVSEKVKRGMAKVVAKAILRVNKEIDLGKFTAEGFGGNVIELIIMDKGEVVTQAYLKLANNKLVVVKEPKEVNLTITAELNTLINAARGKIDLEDAYYFGDIEIYGSSGSVRAFAFFESVWDKMKDEIVEAVSETVEE